MLVPVLVLACILLTLSAAAALADHRGQGAVEKVSEVPFQVHSINDDRCIGCSGCVDACPTNVLALVGHKARPVRFADCVQCNQCVWACPTQALVMHLPSEEPQRLTVPELDDAFQTAVPGQYLIGEVAGKPLVKNAANLGRLVVEHMLTSGLSPSAAPQEQSGDGVVDVAIVGSGPGGLSAALTCVYHKLSYVVLEKEQVVASTVARYPKGKSFMAEPADGDNLSFLPVFSGKKEELVGAWRGMVEGAGLAVKKGEAVEGVELGEDSIFTVTTTVAKYRARRVVLSTGLRGKPRLLAIPGANLPKVHSVLEDADAFGDQDVLVVGGGDSALEATLTLADAGARPTLSYRGDAFKRAKQDNRDRIDAYKADGRIEVLLSSNAREFTEDTVRMALSDGTEQTLPNHVAFLLIGAEPPVKWLSKVGVNFVERPHSYQLGRADTLVAELVTDAQVCPDSVEGALALLAGQAVPEQPKRREQSLMSMISELTFSSVTSISGLWRLKTADPTRVEPSFPAATSVSGLSRSKTADPTRVELAAHSSASVRRTSRSKTQEPTRVQSPLGSAASIRKLWGGSPQEDSRGASQTSAGPGSWLPATRAVPLQASDRALTAPMEMAADASAVAPVRRKRAARGSRMLASPPALPPPPPAPAAVLPPPLPSAPLPLPSRPSLRRRDEDATGVDIAVATRMRVVRRSHRSDHRATKPARAL